MSTLVNPFLSTQKWGLSGSKLYSRVFGVVFGQIEVKTVKGIIFLRNRHFIIQERFNKLIYGTNTIITLTACKISVSLSLLK